MNSEKKYMNRIPPKGWEVQLVNYIQESAKNQMSVDAIIMGAKYGRHIPVDKLGESVNDIEALLDKICMKEWKGSFREAVVGFNYIGREENARALNINLKVNPNKTNAWQTAMVNKIMPPTSQSDALFEKDKRSALDLEKGLERWNSSDVVGKNK